MTITAFSTASGRADHPDPGRTRVLWVACGAHALHDGLTDTLYLLLPLWQAQFALSYAAIGLLRALYTGVMAGFQVPAATLAEIAWRHAGIGGHSAALNSMHMAARPVLGGVRPGRLGDVCFGKELPRFHRRGFLLGVTNL